MKKLLIPLFALTLFACKKTDYREAVVGTYQGVKQVTYVNTGDTIPHHQTSNASVTITVDHNTDDGLIFNGSSVIYNLDKQYKIHTEFNSFYCTVDGYFNNDSLVYSKQCTEGGYTGEFYYLKKQ